MLAPLIVARGRPLLNSATMACVREGVAFGWSTTQIAQFYGIPHNTVTTYQRAVHYPSKATEAYERRLRQDREKRRAARGSLFRLHDRDYEPWTRGNVERLKSLYAEGRSFSEIAKALDCSRSRVAGKLHRLRQAGEL